MRSFVLTSAELAVLWKVPPGTVRRWASEDGWKRTRTRPVRFDITDAQAGYDRRHRTQARVEVRLRDAGGVTLAYGGYKTPVAEADWAEFIRRVKRGEFDHTVCAA